MKKKKLKAPAFPSTTAEVERLTLALQAAEARIERLADALCCEAAMRVEDATPGKTAAIDKVIDIGGLSFRVTRAFNENEIYAEEVAG